jgi:hypothetical protein
MRIPRPSRRLTVLAAVAFGLLVATAAVILYGLPYKRHLEVQHQLAAFRADPTQANAVPLVRMMATDPVDQKDADEILRTWLDLKVVAKESYRPNAPIEVALACGSMIEFRAPRKTGFNQLFVIDGNVTLRIAGLTSKEGIVNSQSVLFDPSFRAHTTEGWSWESSGAWPWSWSGEPAAPRPAAIMSRPGVYPGVLVFEGEAQACYAADSVSIRIVPLGWLDRTLIRVGLKEDTVDIPPPVYRFAIEVPLEVRVEDAPAPAPAVQ